MKTHNETMLMLSVRHAEVVDTSDAPRPGTSLGEFRIDGELQNNSQQSISFSRNLTTIELVDADGNDVSYITSDLEPTASDCFAIEPGDSTSFVIACKVHQPVVANAVYTVRIKNNELDASTEFEFESLTSTGRPR